MELHEKWSDEERGAPMPHPFVGKLLPTSPIDLCRMIHNDIMAANVTWDMLE